MPRFPNFSLAPRSRTGDFKILEAKIFHLKFLDRFCDFKFLIFVVLAQKRNMRLLEILVNLKNYDSPLRYKI